MTMVNSADWCRQNGVGPGDRIRATKNGHTTETPEVLCVGSKNVFIREKSGIERTWTVLDPSVTYAKAPPMPKVSTSPWYGGTRREIHVDGRCEVTVLATTPARLPCDTVANAINAMIDAGRSKLESILNA